MLYPLYDRAVEAVGFLEATGINFKEDHKPMNSKPKMEEMIRLIWNCIDSVDAGAEAILYGSRARGGRFRL